MSDSKGFNEKDLEQVSGGTVYYSADFCCPVCNYNMHQRTTCCEIGDEGPVCTKCKLVRGQKVKMIRIS